MRGWPFRSSFLELLGRRLLSLGAISKIRFAARARLMGFSFLAGAALPVTRPISCRKKSLAPDRAVRTEADDLARLLALTDDVRSSLLWSTKHAASPGKGSTY